MKKFLIFAGGFLFGYLCNTQKGKQILNWGGDKIKGQYKKLLGKIDDLTIPKTSGSEEE